MADDLDSTFLDFTDPYAVGPLAQQRALSAKVRRNPALTMPTAGVEQSASAGAGTPPVEAAAAPASLSSGDIMRQISQKIGNRPDPAQHIEYAKQRASESDRKQMLGLTLAAMGGESFQGAAGHILNQALKTSGDYEIPGGWGVIGRDGKVTWNEAKQEEADIGHLTRLLSIQERSDAARREDARRRDADRDRLETRRLVAGMAGGARADAANDRRQQNLWRMEDQTRNHFDQVTKDTRDVLNMSRALTTLPANGVLTPVQQQSLIIMLNKFQDPGSVVREGEFDRVAAAQGLLQRWGNLPAKIATGQPLPPALVRDVQQVIRIYNEAAENTMRETANDYILNARKRGLDPTQIVTDPRWHPKQNAPGRGTAESPIRVTPRGSTAGGAGQQIIDVNY